MLNREYLKYKTFSFFLMPFLEFKNLQMCLLNPKPRAKSSTVNIIKPDINFILILVQKQHLWYKKTNSPTQYE